MAAVFYYLSAAFVGGGLGTSGIIGQFFLWSAAILLTASFAFKEGD
ncbi:hypothetical protein [Paraburkholderia ginsengiterrae]|nr:hypothetical protein [Paraburkholderia ginsengiterrae]